MRWSRSSTLHIGQERWPDTCVTLMPNPANQASGRSKISFGLADDVFMRPPYFATVTKKLGTLAAHAELPGFLPPRHLVVIRERAAIFAVTAAVAAFAAYGVLADSPFTWTYVTITLALTAVVALIHSSVDFSSPVLGALVVAAVGNLAGGILLVDRQPLYVLRVAGEMRYDKPYHFIATGIAAWAAYEVLSGRSGPDVSRWGVRLLAVLVALGAGAGVEVVEFAGSILIENANVGDYGDNMLDLVANLSGAVCAVGVASFWRPAQR